MRYTVPRLVVLISLLLCLVSTHAWCKRVLVVTTEQQLPVPSASGNGEFVVTDLVASGIPFDVATYGRFISMPLDNYDVIFLDGHTTPTPVADVASRCTQAMQSGCKIFVNGDSPQWRYSADGSTVAEINYYVQNLFHLTGSRWVMLGGIPVVPASVEKDPYLTSLGLVSEYMLTYQVGTVASMQVTAGGYTIGFLCPQGGAIDGDGLCLLDYGRVVNYLRYGAEPSIGFANDRSEGLPIAAFEVHCDSTSNLTAIDAINALSRTLGMPLINLLVYKYLDPPSTSKWNSLDNPLMTIGSHTRTHPQDWPSVPDVLYETTQVIQDQRLVIPATKNYLNFSGDMNPTTGQIDQLYAAGLVYGGCGNDPRMMWLQNAPAVTIQRMPTNKRWLVNLSQCGQAPYCPSLTLLADNECQEAGLNYADTVQTDFARNLRYGMYTYGFFHDYMMDPSSNHYVGGVHMSSQIWRAMEYLQSQGVRFLAADDLVLRLRDFMGGYIQRSPQPDGSVTLTVFRPDARANEIKIGYRNGIPPVVSGTSVLSQHRADTLLYVTLANEPLSTVTVRWAPGSPSVTVDGPYVCGASQIHWDVPAPPLPIGEYQYALGSTPGAVDTLTWTSAGTATSAMLSQAPLVHGNTYYAAVRARYADGSWSEPGVSPAFVADLVPPIVGIPDVTQNGISLLGSGAGTAAQGRVDIVVALVAPPISGLRERPTLTVTNGADSIPVSADPVNANGTLPYHVSIDASTPVGNWTVTAQAVSNTGLTGQTTAVFQHPSDSITGRIELEGFQGASREVVFIATGGTTSKTWKFAVNGFVNAMANYTLQDVPSGTTGLSAKTNWTLRRKVAVSGGKADFVGTGALPAGDLDGSNSVNILDYSILKTDWYTSSARSDINGDGAVNATDYALMKVRMLSVGDPQ